MGEEGWGVDSRLSQGTVMDMTPQELCIDANLRFSVLGAFCLRGPRHVLGSRACVCLPAACGRAAAAHRVRSHSASLDSFEFRQIWNQYQQLTHFPLL